MIILYIPFTKAEKNGNLVHYAQAWKKKHYDKETNSIPSAILTPNEKVANPKNIHKIYILGFQSSFSKEIALSDSLESKSIDVNELIKRLVGSSLLPLYDEVELKLCIQKKTMILSENSINQEDVLQALDSINYQNSNLSVVVDYSTRPFPGQERKKAQRHFTFPLELKPTVEPAEIVKIPLNSVTI